MGLTDHDEGGQIAHAALLKTLPRSLEDGLDGHASRHAMQPTPNGVSPPDRARLADHYQERRLERVLDLGRIVQDAAADAQDHRPVPHHQCLECRLVTARQVSLQELAVGQPLDDSASNNP